MQRSGSGWFETLLNSHTNVSSNGEIFGAKSRRTNASVILEIMDNVFNLDWISSSSKNECTAAIGFKWMLNQVISTNPISIDDVSSSIIQFVHTSTMLLLVHQN